MEVAKITQELSDEIAGKQAPGADNLFNPVTDGDGNIVISLLSAQYLLSTLYQVIPWVSPIDKEEF